MTLEWWQALLLGALQGGTEFLPVSSSGHLVFVPFLLAWPAPGLAFDAAVHGGTAGALVAAFRGELAAMARGLVGGADADARLARRLAGLVVVGTLPLVAVGLVMGQLVRWAFASPPAAATGLVATAGILVGGEWWRSRRSRQGDRADPADAAGASAIELGADHDDPHGAGLDGLTAGSALAIGVGQAVAVLPGVSRSGTTIMTGVVCGLTRQAATRFAFLLALPALGGAVAISALEVITTGVGTLGWPALAGAVAVSFAAGLVAIRWLLRLVARTSLHGFAIYCAAAGALGWVAVLMIGAGGGG